MGNDVSTTRFNELLNVKPLEIDGVACFININLNYNDRWFEFALSDVIELNVDEILDINTNKIDAQKWNFQYPIEHGVLKLFIETGDENVKIKETIEIKPDGYHIRNVEIVNTVILQHAELQKFKKKYEDILNEKCISDEKSIENTQKRLNNINMYLDLLIFFS
jgi:hypothetical protein